MPNKNPNQNSRNIPRQRKHNPKAPVAWRCQICHNLNQPYYQFCLQCYMNLHYYSYINNQLFVQHDMAYEEIYYQVRHQQAEEEPASDCSIEEPEAKDMEMGWVDDLLRDD